MGHKQERLLTSLSLLLLTTNIQQTSPMSPLGTHAPPHKTAASSSDMGFFPQTRSDDAQNKDKSWVVEVQNSTRRIRD